MRQSRIMTFFFFILSIVSVSAYKPVILVHGAFGSVDNEFGNTFEKWIPAEHAGTVVRPIRLFEKACSLLPMWVQIERIKREVGSFMAKHPAGVHFLCYSQGGLLCRGILSSMNHTVHTFVSLSSPQAGQYGISTSWSKNLDFVKVNAYKVLYTKPLQKMLSIANYWNDPHHQPLYQNFSEFLSPLDGSSKTPNISEFKENFLKLKRLVLIGGPDDEIITPWQSSQFGFYDNKENIVEMKKQKFFLEDSFGLRTLYKRGGVLTFTFPGIQHHQWYINRTVFEKAVLPFLN
ncbi:lysosomal thioesterase PPT2-like [Crassostrea virginica]